MSRVAVLIISHKNTLSSNEIISVKQCYNILGKHSIKFVCPSGLDTTEYYAHFGNEIDFYFVDPKWLGSYAEFNRLKISPLLYRAFSQFSHILFYEPDAFVFRDDLLSWCEKDYDFVGAPWLEGRWKATVDSPYVGVGNGGLSLRKIATHLRVLKSLAKVRSFKDYWYVYRKMNWKGKIVHLPQWIFGYFIKNRFQFSLNDFNGHEDVFWGEFAAKKFDWYKVAPVQEALKFSMEVQPRRMFKDNNEQLPMGCHAWWKYDLDFWRDKITHFGFTLDE